MNFSKRNQSIVDFIFVLVLLGVFAVSAMFVVLFGAKIFRNTTEGVENNYSKRTACLYVQEKVRSFDETSSVDITENNGKTILKFLTSANGSEYITYMYLHDGFLMECTLPKDVLFEEGMGQKVVELSKFEASVISKDIICFHVADSDGNSFDFYKNVQTKIKGGSDEVL